MHVADMLALRQQSEQQRCGNVVGQVANNPQVRTQLAELQLERIHLEQVEVADVFQGLTQQLDQIPVNFHRVEALTPIEKRACQCTLTGANLDQMVFRCRVYRIYQSIDNRLVPQEVLTEAFSWARAHQFWCA